MKNLFGIICFITAIGATGCSTIGNNSSYALQYKRDLLDGYVQKEQSRMEILRSGTATTVLREEALSRQQCGVADMQTFLPNIYKSGLPFMLGDLFDTRGKRQIQLGEPLNIIINKIHLKESGETLPGDTGEIAVIVTVDDGKGEKPTSVIVSYEEGIDDNIDLPISSLLAYSTDSYGGEPVRIEISVLELDGKEIGSYKSLLKEAAGIGSSAMAAYAPAISIAAKMGDFLLNQKKDDVLVKFTFQLYPADRGITKPSQSFGVPRLSQGSYIIFNAEHSGQPADTDNIQVDYKFIPYRLLSSVVTSSLEAEVLPVKIINMTVSSQSVSVPHIEPVPWPGKVLRGGSQALSETYAVFTVDNTHC